MKINLGRKLFTATVVMAMSATGVIASSSVLPASASTASVVVPCDGTAIPGAPADQTISVTPGDTVTISSSSASLCDTYFTGTSVFGLTTGSATSFPGGTLTFTISTAAVPGDYYIVVYQTKLNSSHPNDDWGQKLDFKVPVPTYPYSISSCSFSPTSNSVNYGQTVSSSFSFSGTPDPSTSEVWFWHQRLLDGQELPNTDPAVSQPDVISTYQSPYTFQYGSSISNPGYYYPGHTLTENIYAINPTRTGPYGSPICTLTTTFGPAPSTTGTQYLVNTSESCATIKNETAKPLSNLVATLAMQGNKTYISGINPGSAFYWAKVNLNGSSSTSLFTQGTSSGSLRLAPMGSNYVYDSNCNLAKKGPAVTVASNGSSASFSGGTSGSTYFIAIKLGPNYIVNQQVPSSWPLTLTFTPGFGAAAISATISPKKG